MFLLADSVRTPEQHLACDEGLLDAVEHFCDLKIRIANFQVKNLRSLWVRIRGARRGPSFGGPRH